MALLRPCPTGGGPAVPLFSPPSRARRRCDARSDSPVTQILRRVGLCLVTAGACACVTTWRAQPDVLRAALAPREQVRIWARGQDHRVHGVRVVGDSVVAVPFLRPPSCDSCAVRFALREVDSVQVRVVDRRGSITAAIVTGVIVIPLLYYMSELRGMKD
jgi:hypothetical protein